MRSIASVLTVLLLVAPVGVHAEKGAKSAEKKTRVTWLGHATFEIVSPGGTRLLIDPFLTKNPKMPEGRKDLEGWRPDALLLTHSHFDHVADAKAIAAGSGAKVIGASDHIRALDVPEGQKAGGNVGGRFEVGDTIVHLVPAVHGSEPGGRPLGFVVEVAGGPKIYHSGDTWIFGDMALVQEIHRPDVLLLQAGGGPYNQAPAVAALAVKKYFKPKVIVPMHYGTFPVLASEAEVRAAFKGDERVRILKPGESLEL